MAPLDFGDKINLYALIGTWLGTLFTFVGLVAVIAQLRTLIKDYSNSRDEMIKAAAGDWAICISRLRRSDTGIIESKALSLRPWIHFHYTQEKSIIICPYERKSLSGQSSWSRLFSRLQIMPDDLLNLAHKAKSHVQAAEAVSPLGPGTADLLLDGSKLSYGLPGDDFAALLILAGFSPSKFGSQDPSSQESHVGFMYLARHDDPLSQIAQLDETFWNASGISPGSHWEGRPSDRLNVRKCFDLALGILRFKCDGKPATLLFADGVYLPQQSLWPRPSSQQVVKIRRSLVRLTGGSLERDSIFDITRTAFPNFSDIFSKSLDVDKPLEANLLNKTLELAFAIKALQPWGFHPVISRSIIKALSPHLEDPFGKKAQKPSSIPTLIQKFRDIPKTAAFTMTQRPRRRIESSLDYLAEVETHSFLGLSARCSLYYDTMIYVFSNHGLCLEQVQIELAVHCATKYLAEQQNLKLDVDKKFREFVRKCLGGDPSHEIEPWACEILSTYIYAWFQGSKDMVDDFQNILRRRVFLG